ncbi:MAG: hypothetical protein ACK4UZ_01515 [Rhizobium rhizophilum]
MSYELDVYPKSETQARWQDEDAWVTFTFYGDHLASAPVALSVTLLVRIEPLIQSRLSLLLQPPAC